MGEACGMHGRKSEIPFDTKVEGTRPRDGVDWTDRFRDRNNWRTCCEGGNNF
jgi:hypothetical protein